MLSAYVNASDMEGAEKFFRRLKQDGFKPNIVTYGTLIKGYAKVENLDKMMELYEQMQASGIKPNQMILTTIMDAYGKNKDFDSAVIWYKELESRGFSPDQKAKNILLSLAKTAHEQEEANELVGNWDNHSGEPRINGSIKFVVDDDDEEDEDNDNEDDESDVYTDDNGYHEQEIQLNFIKDDNQQKHKGLHDLQRVDL